MAKRVNCTVTMSPELHQKLKSYCAKKDKPITVWVRELIQTKLTEEG